MWRNYFKIAARTIRRRPGTAVINVLGLAVGLAACLLIGLWVRQQLSHDDFHPSAERIARVEIDVVNSGDTFTGPLSPYPMASTLVSSVPEVEAATRFTLNRESVVTIGNEGFARQRVVDADTAFFDVMDGFDVVRGNPTRVLDDAQSAVVTRTAARRYFGTTDAVGQTLRVEGTTYRVAGVMADVPDASHVHFDVVVRLQDEMPPSPWLNNNYHTYARLQPGTAPSELKPKLDAIVDEHVAPALRQVTGTSSFQAALGGGSWEYWMRPLTEIHLHADSQYELEPTGSMGYVYTFSAVALFLLLIACVNFMNLATARAAERATEVGVRKSVGADRRQLAGQFLGEAVLTTAVAMIVAVVLASSALPVFNGVAGTSIGAAQLVQPDVLAAVAGLLLVVGLVAGSYPAFALSRFSPAAVLKSGGRSGSGGGSARLRQALVVFQFTVSIALIIGTLVVRDQFSYVQSKRLGLQTEHVVSVSRASALGEAQSGFIQDLRRRPGVESVSAGSDVFGQTNTFAYFPSDRPRSESVAFNTMQVDTAFFETLDVQVTAGRAFSPERPSDSTAVLINEAAAENLGWSRPDGHALRVPETDSTMTAYDVIGFVDNFHYQSLRRSVRPLVLTYATGTPDRVYVRTAAGGAQEAVDQIREAWQRVAGSEPLQYAFLDQSYAALHRDVQRTGRLFTVFALLTIAIACLGLFGLATHTAQQRTKEIGIRKALGATSAQIVRLLSMDFLRLVALAFAVAVPIAYAGVSRWLQGYAYRIDLTPTLFLVAGALTFAIAFATIATHALRAARTDPASTLQSE